MRKVKIKEPIWATQSVGIAERLLDQDGVQVTISYKDKAGNKVFPDTYYIPSIVAKNFPTQIRRGVNLKIIPIKAFKVINQ